MSNLGTAMASGDTVAVVTRYTGRPASFAARGRI
jgi:hypothetical protein